MPSRTCETFSRGGARSLGLELERWNIHVGLQRGRQVALWRRFNGASRSGRRHACVDVGVLDPIWICVILGRFMVFICIRVFRRLWLPDWDGGHITMTKNGGGRIGRMQTRTSKASSRSGAGSPDNFNFFGALPRSIAL